MWYMVVSNKRVHYSYEVGIEKFVPNDQIKLCHCDAN